MNKCKYLLALRLRTVSLVKQVISVGRSYKLLFSRIRVSKSFSAAI